MSTFPDCTLHFLEQRTPEWFDLRKGRLTASQFGPWLVKSDKTSEKARQTAICTCLAEYAGCEMPPNVENWAMRRGTELEPLAIARFTELTGLAAYPVGFALHKSGAAGCSPDSLLVGRNEGLECKCPVPATHVKYLLDGGLPETYREQVHGSMAVTGADAWWFFSYCPGLPSVRLLIQRDDYTRQIESALWTFASQLEEAREKVKAMWDAEFQGGVENA